MATNKQELETPVNKSQTGKIQKEFTEGLNQREDTNLKKFDAMEFDQNIASNDWNEIEGHQSTSESDTSVIESTESKPSWNLFDLSYCLLKLVVFLKMGQTVIQNQYLCNDKYFRSPDLETFETVEPITNIEILDQIVDDVSSHVSNIAQNVFSLGEERSQLPPKIIIEQIIVGDLL